MLATVFVTSLSISHASEKGREAITELKKVKEELLLGEPSADDRLKVEILDRMILSIDSYYISGDLRLFLAKRCEKMAEREIQNPQTLNSHVWRYLKDLAVVFERSRQTNLSAFLVLKTYFEYSDVLQPKDPQKFVLEADYSNGKEFLNIQI